MGYVGIEEDYYVPVKSVLDITAETGALTTQFRIKELTPADVAPVVHGRWIQVGMQDMMLRIFLVLNLYMVIMKKQRKKIFKMNFIKTIIKEMANGNFSFAILIVGIAQFFAMIKERDK